MTRGPVTQTLDVERSTSGFVVLDASNVAAGPVSTVELGEIMPIGCHGRWGGRVILEH
jgi:carotenoid cleavage dioxygenase-like enzyme